MKYICIVFILCLSFISCKKEERCYHCTSVTQPDTSGGQTVVKSEFCGTTENKQKHEEKNTYTGNVYVNGQMRQQTTVTKCH